MNVSFPFVRSLKLGGARSVVTNTLPLAAALSRPYMHIVARECCPIAHATRVRRTALYTQKRHLEKATNDRIRDRPLRDGL